jgi:hypothetical protein
MRLHLLLLLTILLNITAFAAIPPMISYQGKLTKADGTLLPDGVYSMRFAIYTVPAAGDMIWSETNPAVQVKKGLFSVLLGRVVNLPGNIFDSTDRYFGVKVGDDAEMTPRQQIASVPFAFRAASAGTVDDRSITKEKLAHDVTSVTTDAIATGWIPSGETWVYSSPGIITSGTNPANTKYSVGDKVKFTQDGITKYGYIYLSSNVDAGIYFTGGTDYTLTNSLITNVYYSKSSNPIGFPGWFNFEPYRTVYGGIVPTYTDYDYSRFNIEGCKLTISLYWLNTVGGIAGSGEGQITISSPVPTTTPTNTTALGLVMINGNLVLPAGAVKVLSATSLGLYNWSTGGSNCKGILQNNSVRQIIGTVVLQL